MGVRWSRNQPKIAKIGIRGKNHKIIYFSIFYYVEGGSCRRSSRNSFVYLRKHQLYQLYQRNCLEHEANLLELLAF